MSLKINKSLTNENACIIIRMYHLKLGEKDEELAFRTKGTEQSD